MASVKVILYTSKTLKNGEHPLMLRIIKDRKVSYQSIGVSCKKAWWNEKDNEPNKKHPNREELIAVITKKIADARKLMLNYENDEKDYSAEEIVKKAKNKFKKTTVLLFFDEIIKRMIEANRIGNANAFKDAKRALFRFRNGKDFSFSDMDVTFLNKLEEYLLGNGVTENSISVYMRSIRAIYNRAIAEGYIAEDSYPFKHYKISKLNTKTRKRALTREQFLRFMQINVPKDRNIYDSKNYFLFSFYTMGINLVDMAHLKWKDNIENGRLKYVRAKTGKHYNIKLLPPALEILEYYKSENFGSEYIFPILNEKIHITPIQQDDRITKVSQWVNEDLKEIAKAASVDFEITFYVARHTWATLLKKSGVSTSVISEAMKHDTEKTTQIYLDSFEDDTLDKANENLLKLSANKSKKKRTL